MINAEFLMLLGGVGAFVMTLYWVRVRELRERYAIGWLAVRLGILMTREPLVVTTSAGAG